MKYQQEECLKSRLMQCAAVSALAAVMTAIAPQAAAQQTLPGTSPNCPIVDGEAVCEGDLEDGVTVGPGGPVFDTLIITNPTTPIAPQGYFGIGVVRNDDVTVQISDDVVINVFDNPGIPGAAQGLIAIAGNGADLTIDTGADITANGNGSIALGIEAVAQDGDGNVDIVNRGSINAFTDFPAAIAIQARQINSTGDIMVENSGALTATSGGGGERDFVTAGILARHETGGGDIEVVNSGEITVSASTTDTDFNGVAAGIVTNSFIGANTTLIDNSGSINSTGNAVHGIVGFTSNDISDETAQLSIENSGTLAIDGADNYGILAQTAGTNVNTTVSNTGDITMANGANSNGLFVLARANTASSSLSNEGDISGTGTLLRGMGMSTFLAPPGGTYDMSLFNEGDVTLDAAHGLGITVFATREDETQVDLTNLGNLDLSAATNDLSNGISVNLNQVDTNAGGAVGSSRLTLFNGGDVTMGAGRGFFLIADEITAENAGDISMANGTGILAQDFDTLSLTNSGAITTTGANSDGIIVDASASDDWGVTVTDTGSVITSGEGSVAIRVAGTTNDYLQNLIQETTARVTVNKARMADRAMNAITEYVANSAVAAAPPTLPSPPGGASTGRSVTINGTVQADGGAGAIVSAGALDVSAANPGATIATTGDNAPVISAQGALSLSTSDRLVLSSTGNNSPLFQVLGGGDSAAGAVLIDIDASTTGDNSTAFQLDSGGGNSVGNLEIYSRDAAAPSTISTAGAGSHAVQFDTTATGSSTFTGEVYDSQISTAGNGSMAFNLDLGLGSSASLGLIDSTVTTGGTDSDAVHVGVGDGSDVLLLVQRSTISTSGAGSDAIDIPQVVDSSIGNLVIVDSDVSTSGDDARAVVFAELAGDASSRGAFIANSTIATEGDGATAIQFGQLSGSPASEESVATFDLFDSSITTAGADAWGVYYAGMGQSSAIDFTGDQVTITTQGDNSGALYLGGIGSDSAESFELSNMELTTAGANADALFLEGIAGDSSVFASDMLNLTIVTSGANSRGIIVEDLFPDSDSTAVFSADNLSISTTGANAHGYWLGNSSTGATIGSTLTIDSTGLDITTQGEGARGLYIAGLANDAASPADSSLISLLMQDMTISTSGANAVAFEAFGVDGVMTNSSVSFLADSIDITTTGAGSHGFVVGGLPEAGAADTNDTQLAINFGTINVSGEGADAIRIGAGWGVPDALTAFQAGDPTRFAAMEISEAVSATGTGGNGLVTDSLINVFEVSENGSLTADAFAILSQGNGGIESLTNAGTITGDIQLGDEDSDVLLTGTGTITGNIDMGGGVNTLTIEDGGVLNSLERILLGSGNTFSVSGTLSPGQGGPLQVTSVGSDLVFEAGSRFLVDVDGNLADGTIADTGASDRLEVDGAVTINGGAVVVSSMTPEEDFEARTEFEILNATGGVTGTFADLESDLPFLMLSLQYGSDDIRLIAEREIAVAPEFASIARTPNQRAVAGAFDAAEPDATGDFADVIDALIFSDTAQALAAFDTTSGEVYASLVAGASLDSLAQSRRTLDRARRMALPGWGAWASVSGSNGSLDSDGNGAELDRSDLGLEAGIDYAGEANRWAVGLSAGLRRSSADIDARRSSAEYEGWDLAAYGRYGTGGPGMTLNAAATWSQGDADVSRRITVGTLDRRAKSEVSVESQSLAGEARYGFPVGETLAIGPVVSATHVSADLGGMRETGAGSLNLTARSASGDQTVYGGGLFANWQDTGRSLDLSVQYVDGASGAMPARLSFAGAPTVTYTVRSPDFDPSGVLASASGTVDLGQGWGLAAQVNGFASDDTSELGASVTLGWKF